MRTQPQHTAARKFQSNQKVHEYSTIIHSQGISIQSESTRVLNYNTQPEFLSNHKVHEYSTTVHIWGFTVQSENTLVLNYNTQSWSFCPVTKYMSTQLQYTSGEFLSNHKVHEYSTTEHIWGFQSNQKVHEYSTIIHSRGVSVQSQST